MFPLNMPRLLFAVGVSLLSQLCWGQYFVQSTGSITGSCTIFDVPDATQDRVEFSITAPGIMTLPAVTPSSPTNFVAIGGTNVGGRWFMTLSSASGAPLPSPLPWIVHRLPTPGNPVTLGLSFYPVMGGTAVGTGFGADLSCAYNGGGSTGIFTASPTVPVSAEVGAAYQVTYSGGVINGSCSATNVSGAINGTVYLPPPLGDNLMAAIAINGAPYATDYGAFNPANSSALQTFSYNIPATAIPYSVTGTVFPWRNGAPVGTGVSITYFCTAQGLSASIPQSIPAQVSSAVPTLSFWGLLGLIGSMAWIARRTYHKA
jgi:hypothetical protein